MLPDSSPLAEPPKHTSDSPSNGPQFGLSRALKNFKSALLEVAAKSLNRPLTGAEVSWIEKNLSDKSNILSHTPDHPPYAAMILMALQELNEEGGSSDESISNFIRKEFPDLPWAHSTYLKHHLHNLCDSKEIFLNSENCYLLADENPPSPASSESYNPKEELRKRRKIKRKRNKVKNEKMGTNDLEIVVREEQNKVVEEHNQQIEELHSTSEVLEELELKNDEGETPEKPMKMKLLSDIRMPWALGKNEPNASSTSDPFKETGKANWTLSVHEIFVDVCLEEILKGNKPSTFFNQEGWKNIVNNFYEKSGLRYDRKQLKNHWDLTKAQWKIWSKLITTSSMGWDQDTQTFAASEDDWANYIQANPDAAHYRYKVPLLADKLSVIYHEDAQKTPLATKHELENETIVTECVPLAVVDEDQNIKKYRRRKLKRKVCNDIIEDTPISQNKSPSDFVESKNNVTQSSQGKLSYSIGECIECLDGMSEIEPGSDLYLFALDIFLKREFREVFLQLKKPGVRVAWLRRMQLIGTPSPLH